MLQIKLIPGAASCGMHLPAAGGMLQLLDLFLFCFNNHRILATIHAVLASSESKA